MGFFSAGHALRNIAARPEVAIVIFDSAVQRTAHLRLYRVIASQHFMLDPDGKPDQRTPVVV